jgi:hypothetical protein
MTQPKDEYDPNRAVLLTKLNLLSEIRTSVSTMKWLMLFICVFSFTSCVNTCEITTNTYNASRALNSEWQIRPIR